MKTIKIILADDHEIFRNGLSTLISNEPDMKVVGEASDGEQVIDMVKHLEPDVLILDIRMPKLNGIDTAKKLLNKSPHLRILIFSLYDNEDYVLQALHMGAKGYLLKDTSNKIFLDAIRAVDNDQFYYIGDVSNSVIKHFKNQNQPEVNLQDNNVLSENLSKKEKEIINLIIEGKNSKEIADVLGNSVRTIDAHRYNIIKKFGTRSIEEAIVIINKMN
ncbi:response regulator transcription factor [Flavobacterium sp. 7A]|uniref:response regulator transcription factor n=1 Tax=Flavobacterium sp. 7A TaxID=2940571 RepID=UPI0022279589|nr:response regulator transcription factor [Flavobacterium sp. 7A]MCW2119329.1 DNA-binding NarL/FixJ family response regulator [Flavobacterium sp. 7A]